MYAYKKTNIWDTIVRLVHLQELNISRVNENVQLFVYAAASFFIPVLLKHPQILVGTFVNLALVLAALNLRGKKLLPVIIFPSLGALAGGYLFRALTPSLIYLIPFIWAGNALLVLSFKYFKLHKKQNFFLTLAIGSVLKSGFLFAATLLLVLFTVIPQQFLIISLWLFTEER